MNKMIKCSHCGKEVECNKCRHGKYEAIANAKCVCLDCFIKSDDDYDGAKLLYMVGCWNRYSKEEIDKLQVAIEL